MQFKNFNLKDEKEINQFLKESGDKIGQGGVLKGVDSVSFLYSEETDEEYAKTFRRSSIKNGILQFQSKIDTARAEELFYRERVQSADKDLQGKYGDLIINASNTQKELAQQIKASEEVLAEI